MSMLKSQNEQIIVFEAVMRTGSLSGAARDLGLSQPTVRRVVEALEHGLDESLFKRSDNGLIPTDKAYALWPNAKTVVEKSFAFFRAANSDSEKIAGTVRISASRVVSQFRLPEMIAELHRQYPNLRAELVPDDRPTDLLRSDADVAIRHVAPTQKQLVAKKAASIELGLFSRTDIGPKDIHSCLEDEAFIWEDRGTMLEKAAEQLRLPKPVKISAATDDQALQLALISEGVGIGICQVPIASTLGLHRVDANWQTELPVWIAAHEDQINNRPLRLTFDFLYAGFGS
ncbi:MAG: LysR family transcriptional regulator [Pseudomonadota bacterium]